MLSKNKRNVFEIGTVLNDKQKIFVRTWRVTF